MFAEYYEKAKLVCKKRKRVVSVLIVSVLVISIFALLPLASFLYRIWKEESSEVIVYQTPSGGVSLRIGQWFYRSFDIEEPPSDVQRMIEYRLLILDWGDCPDKMKFSRLCWGMTISKFEEMLASGELDDYQAGSIIERPRTEYEDGWHSLGDVWGTQVCAVHFLDYNGNVTSGTLKFSLTIVTRDFFR